MAEYPKVLNVKVRTGLDRRVIDMAERLHTNPNNLVNECLQAVLDSLETRELDVPPLITFYRRALGKSDSAFWLQIVDKLSNWGSAPGFLMLYGRQITRKELGTARELWSAIMPVYAQALAPQRSSDWIRVTAFSNLRAYNEIIGKDILQKKFGWSFYEPTPQENAAIKEYEPEIAEIIQRFKEERKIPTLKSK